MKLTQAQNQIIESVKTNGSTGISRSDVRLHKSYMNLVNKGLLKIERTGEYHTFFVLP